MMQNLKIVCDGCLYSQLVVLNHRLVVAAVLGTGSPPLDAGTDGSSEQKQRPQKRKSVSWAPDESLRKIHIFDLDEAERGRWRLT